MATQEEDLRGKLALVTGANSGVGKETALQLCQRGCTVVMCCRSMNKADAARNDIMKRLDLKDFMRLRLVQLDLSDLDNVGQFNTRLDAELGKDLKDAPLDIAIMVRCETARPKRSSKLTTTTTAP